ncbi:11428_t:CDS:2 [Paraglomus brasilianum]|uniref:11428_t:CDS:1 n=1 Tax=Paraglomus brasilianum TaxID=144538 RepID=A0A9N9H677_9GLOM|nr:11428_t:CDS:2 [Paraglomus brasilianum]
MSSSKTIELTDLEIPQLIDVKKQLEAELAHLSTSYGQLKQAQNRFQDCIESVGEIRDSKPGKGILVPLTESISYFMYIEKVIVDVGTGYYIEKDIPDAIKFYVEKVDYVKKNLETLDQTITIKQNNLQATIEVMQMKISLMANAKPSSSK